MPITRLRGRKHGLILIDVLGIFSLMFFSKFYTLDGVKISMIRCMT